MSSPDTIRKSIADLAGQGSADAGKGDVLNRSCDIIIAFLNNNKIAPADVPVLIASVHATLTRLFGPTAEGVAPGKSVDERKIHETITPDYIVCLEDGKRLQTLRRYIRGRYGLSPDQYRKKWGLPDDYPMVAPNYAKRRSQIAKQMGLGRKPAKKRKKRR